MTPSERFWAKVRKTDGCWFWTAGITPVNPYGRFRLNGKVERAHRVAFVLTNGAIPNGCDVLHHCDIPPCVRPDHLFLGTQIDNVNDMLQKGRHVPVNGTEHSKVMSRVAARGEDWKRAHPEKFISGENATTAKLTFTQAKEIVRLSVNFSQRQLARQFGVCKSTIGNIIRGERYQSHIN